MSIDERKPGEAWCHDCPDHEACATGWRCDDVKEINDHARDLVADLAQRDATIAAVRALHRPSLFPKHGGPFHGKTICVECSNKGWAEGDQPGEVYPCPTIRALDGGDQ